METPNFICGTEKRFAEFISKLNDKDKIAIISHVDLDGIAAAKITNEVIQADIIKLKDYKDMNGELIKELKEKEVTKIIITDICVYEPFIKLLEKDFEALIIDHHPPQKDFNSEKIIFLNAQDNCAAYLCHYLFSKIQDIEKLDWLTACGCIADWSFQNNQEFMSKVFKKYNDKFELINNVIRKNGKLWDLQWNISLALIYFKDNPKKVLDSVGEKFGDIGDLNKYVEEVNNYLNKIMERFEKEKKEINGRIFWEFTPKFNVGSIISTLTSSETPNKTVIIARNDEKLYKFSMRRQDKKEDVGQLITSLIKDFKESLGGGHIPAAGGHILLKDKEKFIQRLKSLQ